MIVPWVHPHEGGAPGCPWGLHVLGTLGCLAPMGVSCVGHTRAPIDELVGWPDLERSACIKEVRSTHECI